MNNATTATVEILKAAVKAHGYFAHVREEYRGATVFVESDQSRFVGYYRRVSLGRVDVFESGRWQAFETSGVSIMKVSPELDAIRFRRAA